MATLDEHESFDLVKMLLLSPSGHGKTGALAALVNVGFKLRILDFDNGVGVLRNYITDKSRLRTHVTYKTLRDDIALLGGRMGIKKATAYQEALDCLQKGGEAWGPGSEVKPLFEMGPDEVVVVDTLSTMGRSSLNMVQAVNGAGFKHPEIQHYGTAMDNIEKLLDMITSDKVKCNVIVSTHTYTPEGETRPVPEALGSKLGPKVPKVFDNMFSLTLSQGVRTFKTDKDGLLALKSAVPLKPTYPIETGLADIFQGLTGKPGPDKLAKAA